MTRYQRLQVQGFEWHRQDLIGWLPQTAGAKKKIYLTKMAPCLSVDRSPDRATTFQRCRGISPLLAYPSTRLGLVKRSVDGSVASAE
jgi:hypothetical protein